MLSIVAVSDDTPQPTSCAVLARIPSQSTRNARPNFRHVRLRLSPFAVFRCRPPADDSIGAFDRATRRDPRAGFSRTPRKGARELRQNTELTIGCYQDVLPLFGIPATVLP